MFTSTYLGHSGWLLSAERARLLVDPILTAGFGLTPSVELHVYPPCTIEIGKFPPVDAIFLTHEHEAHFELASLHAIDRRVPIFLPARSSTAMHRILAEMGFETRPVEPGRTIEIGDLRLLPLTADQVAHGIIDEWDVLPFIVWDRAGDGSFFAQVDMTMTDAMWRLARTAIDRPGLWAHTANASVFDFAHYWEMAPPRSLQAFVQRAFDYHTRLSDEWARPTGLLVAGSGWCFAGEQAWLNRNTFPFDKGAAARILGELLPGELVSAPLPGTTYRMKAGEVIAVDGESEAVVTLPPSEWPDRTFRGDVVWLESYSPATGRRNATDEELEQLARELGAFARHLYASDPFRRLYSLTHEDTRGRKPTFAIVALADADGGACVFEYQPWACAFVPVETEDPVSDYLAVYECWATDLLATLRTNISSFALGFGRYREWNANPDAFHFTLSTRLFEYAHPLRLPDRFLALYRETLASLSPPAERVGWNGR